MGLLAAAVACGGANSGANDAATGDTDGGGDNDGTSDSSGDGGATPPSGCEPDAPLRRISSSHYQNALADMFPHLEIIEPDAWLDPFPRPTFELPE